VGLGVADGNATGASVGLSTAVSVDSGVRVFVGDGKTSGAGEGGETGWQALPQSKSKMGHAFHVWESQRRIKRTVLAI